MKACEPAPILTSERAPETAPPKVAAAAPLRVSVLATPVLVTTPPCPTSPLVSEPMVASKPLRSRVAPARTATVLRVVPSALAEPTRMEPPRRSTPPLKLLLPVTVRAPTPDLRSELEPEMLAETRTAVAESISRAEADSVPEPELMTWPE